MNNFHNSITRTISTLFLGLLFTLVDSFQMIQPHIGAGWQRGRLCRNDKNTLGEASVSVENSGVPLNNSNSNYYSRPIPVMPSPLFQQLALSQLELLASSIVNVATGRPKIKSMVLYLPQENTQTGQLEFSPAVRYPHPSTERVFIANDSDSGVAPEMPRTLTTLPGFAHATTLLPAYPMVSSAGDRHDIGIGVVEEVMCQIDAAEAGASLSVPLFSGAQTVGVLLVSPSSGPWSKPLRSNSHATDSVWTTDDCDKVGQAAKSLSLALSMDTERATLQQQNQQIQEALSDSLHQVKNPLQALRTFGKLLQRRIADGEDDTMTETAMTPQLLELAGHLLIQSDRLADRLKPVDALVEALSSFTNNSDRQHLLQPSMPPGELVRFQTPLLPETSSMDGNDRSEGKRPTESVTTNTVTDNRQLASEPSLKGANNPVSKTLINQCDLELVFVDDLLEPLVSTFAAIAAEKGIEFSFEEADDLPGATVCPEAFQEIVTNVVDNAFKYVTLLGSRERTPATPRVCIKIFPNKDSHQSTAGVTILVEDNGPGIPVEERERVFERGFRGSGVSSAVNGTGIGLGIARSLAEQMGGKLQVASHSCLGGTTMELVVYRYPITLNK